MSQTLIIMIIMKKFLFIAVIIIGMVVSARAQSVSKNYWSDDAIKTSVIAFTGANILEPAPIYGAALGLNCFFMRAEFELGGSWIDPGASFSRKNLLYFSPSIGVTHTFAERYEIYLMSSWINWGYTILEEAPNNECCKDIFEKDLFHWRLKLGTNINFSKRCFANAEIGYMFPKSKETGYIYYDNLSVRVGVGYRF